MFEVKMEDCLIRGDASGLVSVLHHEGLSNITLSRLDQLVTKDLCGTSVGRLLVVMKTLDLLSENCDDLQTLISHGLTAKVLLWFEALHDLLTCDLQKNTTPLLSLTESFYDFFMLLGQSSLPVSQLSVVLLHLGRFALEPELHFPVRLEAIRTFNSILECLSREQRRLIQSDQNQTQIMSQMAAALMSVGDYELQVSLSEALCRLTPRKDREQRANQWFSSRDISMAFCDIRDKDFEADCRQFLNFVNSFHGDQRRVYTFPCLRAFLDSSELFPPKDNKLEKFWIDFNLSSGCVSFFVDEPEGFLWGSIHLLREEVDHYSLQLKHDERCGTHTVLSVRLNNPIMHHNSRGQAVELSFDSDHHRDLEEAAGRVFTTVRTSSPHVAEPSGSGKMSKHNGQFYSRKKSQIKSVLKILPLSSPSSEEDSCVMKRLDRSTAELQFDQIRDSTPTYESGVPVGAGTRILLEKGGSISPLRKEVSSGRKRAAADSGYLSDTPEGEPVHKQRVEPLREEEESVLQLAEGLPEGAGNPPGEKEGLIKDSAIEVPVVSGLEPKSDLTSGITAAFNNFKTQLEDQFTVCWQTVESEVLLSLKECQQHVSSLLTAVHQHRLVLLQTFENNVTDQLKRLQQNSSSLNSMNTQILSFFQIEMQRLGSFCEDHLQRLRSLQSEESTSQQPSSH